MRGSEAVALCLRAIYILSVVIRCRYTRRYAARYASARYHKMRRRRHRYATLDDYVAAARCAAICERRRHTFNG